MDTVKVFTHSYLLPKNKGGDFILDWKELPLDIPFICDHRDEPGFAFNLRTEMEFYLPPGFPVVISERTRVRKMYMLFIPEGCYGEISDNRDVDDVLLYIRKKGTKEEQALLKDTLPCYLPWQQIPGLGLTMTKKKNFEFEMYTSHGVTSTTGIDLLDGKIKTKGKVTHASVLEFFQFGDSPLTISY
jgi:hypothetical protein